MGVGGNYRLTAIGYRLFLKPRTDTDRDGYTRRGEPGMNADARGSTRMGLDGKLSADGYRLTAI